MTSPHSRATAAFDVGGTTIKIALVDDDGRAHDVSRVPTPTSDADGRALTALIAGIVSDLRARGDVSAVGVAVPGIVDLREERAVYSANLGWRDIPIGALLRERIDLPLAISHDIRAGALAEARFGALRGAEDLALFAAIGTGVAIAVVDGATVVAGDPWQGEIGQLLVTDPFATSEVAPLRPLESFASAQGIASAAGTQNSEQALILVRRGDPVATRAWKLGIDALGAAIATTALAFGATRLVIGGGLALAGDQLLTPLAGAINRRLPAQRAVTVQAAALGDLAGCIGAATAAMDLR